MPVRLPDPPEPTPTDQYDDALLAEMYQRMVLIRAFEQKVNELFLQGSMPGTIHLSLGQEATVVGACIGLRTDDFINVTHRGHGQALAKGLAPQGLMAELFGKVTGCCQGRGGSMHIGDMSRGILPGIAIVGAASPIMTGMAFAFQRKRTGQIAVNFFGESAANKGDWHEAMNLAAIWKLPIVFLCENNLYGVSTHIAEMMTVDYVADRAAAYGMPGMTVYGNDPLPVYAAMQQAAARARAGEGPTLLECLTYRRGGHKRDDPATYRDTNEVAAWLQTDPIPAFRSRLLNDGRFTEARLTALESAVKQTLEQAVLFAHASPAPSPDAIMENVYA